MFLDELESADRRISNMAKMRRHVTGRILDEYKSAAIYCGTQKASIQLDSDYPYHGHYDSSGERVRHGQGKVYQEKPED
jgi:hypothetical protein